jgi:hypothetical protein
MPSTTKKQAHYMSAIAHGWNPPGKHPSKAVAEEFHNADKREGKWEHPTKKAGGGRVSRISDLIQQLSDLAKESGIVQRGSPLASFSSVGDFKEAMNSNSLDYLKNLRSSNWVSRLNPDDLLKLDSLASSTQGQKLGPLYDKLSLDLPDTTLYRGLSNKGPEPLNFKTSLDRPQATTSDEDTAYEEYLGKDGGAMVHVLPSNFQRVVPNPLLGVDEYLIPENRNLKALSSSPDEIDPRFNNILTKRTEYASGGLAALPTHLMPQLATPHVSPLSAISNAHIGGISSPSGSFGARARMPRIPISDTLRNIDAHVQGAKIKMPKLAVAAGGRATRPRFDDGGPVQGSSSPGSPGFLGAVHDALAALKDYVIDRPRREMQASREQFENSIVDDNNTAGNPAADPQQRSDYAGGGQVMAPGAEVAIRKALMHLQQKDAGSAAATLHASPHAMAHPEIAAAAQALRSHQGVAPAQQTLQTMQNASQAQKIPAPFRRGGRVR